MFASPTRARRWPQSLVLAALALGFLPTSALAQLDPSRFQLELSLVGRTYSNHVPDVSIVATDVPAPSIAINSLEPDPIARTVRLEVRYRILVLGSTTGAYVGADGITYSSAGLSTSVLALQSSRTLLAGDLRAAEVASAGPVLNPVTLDLSIGTRGLYQVFRFGPVSDQPPGTGLGSSNGLFSASGLTTILPLSISAPVQFSSVLNNSRVWGVYAVDFVVPLGAPDGNYLFNLTPNSTWYFFPRAGTGSANFPIVGAGGLFLATSTFNVFVEQAGSCCAPSGECTYIPQAQCAHPFIHGSLCQPNPCLSPGACCAPAGACTLLLVGDCTTVWNQGGVCLPNPCPQPGPCCAVTGACTFVPQSLCAGVWSQSGACTPNLCPQPGACCSMLETCTLLLQANCTGVAWISGGVCSPNPCAIPGACCGTDCQVLTQLSCTSGRTWMSGTCTPSPCPPPTACCNPISGGCILVLASGDVVYNYSYSKGLPGYARNDAGGTVETITATFSPITKRLVFDAQFSGATSGGPLITTGFWLVLNNGPNPKSHPGELAIFYFDATTLGSPKLTIYAYNGADANTSWNDGDPTTSGEQPGDLIKGAYETSSINTLLAEDTTVMGQPRRHFRFDIDATDILSHVPQYPAASPWYGTGLDRSLGLWLHSSGGFAASYESNFGGARGAITSFATTEEGWLDASARATTNNDPCPSGTRISPASACSPTNTCPQRRACCNNSVGTCLVVGPTDDCPGGFGFDPGSASTCSPNPCPSFALQVAGACCNRLTALCGVMPSSGCNPATHTWVAGALCSASPCPSPQGSCCNVVTGTCGVSSQAACGSAAHDWFAGGVCSPNTCATPGICCNSATGACRRFTQARCSTGSTWAPSGVCSPNPCAGNGRCCNVVTGSCQMLARSACLPGAHDWMPGAACSPNPCATPGICCNTATGACRRFTQSRCPTGSIWSPTGTCSPNSCSAPGRCCNVVTGTCQMTLQSACMPAAHDWMPGAACSPNLCAAPGICCNIATGACRRFTPSRCTSGSIWLTSGVCSPSPCALPQGACCNVVTGTCAVSTLFACPPAAHDWFAGGTCSSSACDPPEACCNVQSGICRRLTPIRCAAGEGVGLNGQTCTPNPCPAALITPCAADFDRSGHADLQDVLAFTIAWFALDLDSDFNASDEISAADVFDFLTAWFAGCP